MHIVFAGLCMDRNLLTLDLAMRPLIHASEQPHMNYIELHHTSSAQIPL